MCYFLSGGWINNRGTNMKAWFLVVTFFSHMDSKVAVYKTEDECRVAMPIAVAQFRKDPDVASITCTEGKLVKQ